MEDHEQLHCFGHWRDGRDRHAHHPLAGRAGANGSRRRPRCRPSNAEFAGQFGGRPLTLDVTDAGSIAAAAAAIPDSTSGGISLDTETRVTETDVEAFRRTYQTNVFRCGRGHQRVLGGASPLGASADRHVSRYGVADLEHRP